MFRYIAVFGVVVLLAAGLWVASSLTLHLSARDCVRGEERAEKPDEFTRRFDALKKRLPRIIADWNRTNPRFKGDPKLRLARRTSPTEVKFTFEAKRELQGETALEKAVDCTYMMVFYLRYYEGTWTTMHWKVDGFDLGQGTDVGQMIQELVLAIDTDEKK
jgi:hypothetical protein